MFPKQKRKEDRKFLDSFKHKPCAVCGKLGTYTNPVTPSHIQTRGSGGGDTPDNVVPMHLDEHIDFERNKRSFCERHQNFYVRLLQMGWEFRLEFGIYKLRRVCENPDSNKK